MKPVVFKMRYNRKIAKEVKHLRLTFKMRTRIAGILFIVVFVLPNFLFDLLYIMDYYWIIFWPTYIVMMYIWSRRSNKSVISSVTRPLTYILISQKTIDKTMLRGRKNVVTKVVFDNDGVYIEQKNGSKIIHKENRTYKEIRYVSEDSEFYHIKAKGIHYLIDKDALVSGSYKELDAKLDAKLGIRNIRIYSPSGSMY